MTTTKKPAFYSMSLQELATWVEAHNKNNEHFDCVPAIDELDDDAETEAREELEAMAEEIWQNLQA